MRSKTLANGYGSQVGENIFFTLVFSIFVAIQALSITMYLCKNSLLWRASNELFIFIKFTLVCS